MGRSEPALRPEVVPAFAFVIGNRHLTLKSFKEARMLFGVVVEKAPAGSPLKSRALKAIDRIDHGKTR